MAGGVDLASLGQRSYPDMRPSLQRLGERYKDWWENSSFFRPALQSLGEAVRLPGDVYAGRVDPQSDDAIARAFDLAGSLTLGAGAVPATANELRMGIKAFHGSPHDFERFDSSKIGTGEGAQAYGHGLYFAENEGVARNYRDALQHKAATNIDSSTAAGAIIANAVKEARKYPESERAAVLSRWLDETQVMALSSKYAPPDLWEHVREAKRLLASGEVTPDLGNAGRMYEVEIAAEPEQFLDWDNPGAIAALPEEVIGPVVQEAYRRGELKPSMAAPEDLQGRDLYTLLALEKQGWKAASNMPGSVQATEALRQAGIPGIKYLDAGSRKAWVEARPDGRYAVHGDFGPGQSVKVFDSQSEAHKFAEGQGTRNYVVFDDSLVTILRKYGLPLTAGGVATLSQMGIAPEAKAAP